MGFENIQVGPGFVTLIGGAPGVGKTALAMQWTIDALRSDTELKAVICNVEMSSSVLLERQIARISGVPLWLIRQRTVPESEQQPVVDAIETNTRQCA